jgi:hypothetical protein
MTHSAMNATGQADSRSDLRGQILTFVHDLRHPVLLEEGGPFFDLTGGEWRLEVEFGKVLLEVWGEGRSVVRRIEAAERKGNRLRLLARRRGGSALVELEICESAEPQTSDRDELASRPEQDPAAWRARERDLFERELLAAIGREFPDFNLERVTHRSNREHSFSACYTRGVARQRNVVWAFLGLSRHEGPAAAENMLASGLIWLDWLRRRSVGKSKDPTVGGLKLFLPPEAVAVAAHRAAYLEAGAVQIFEWTPEEACFHETDLRDYGNVETRLTQRWRGVRLLEQLHPLLCGLLEENLDRVRVLPDATGDALSLRVLGLQVARVEGRDPPKIHFGLEGETQLLDQTNQTEFTTFLESVLRLRRPCKPPDRSHPFYRLQPERWLESVLVDDIARVDPAFVPEHVYPQVPAFSGPANPALSRGVIDILGVIRDGSSRSHRLAVVELKLDEDPNLPLQGLDYWLRVKWLQDRDQFRQFGYFTGLEPSAAPPVLYLVCPAFRFHSTTDRLLRYFHPSIRLVKVGINQRWREGVKVLFRRTLEQGRVCDDSGAEAH